MKRVGVVGLDTSHSEAFASLLEDRESVTLNAVWDSGEIRDDDYIDNFCDQYGATRFETPGAMVDAVDGVLILTVDWDTHCELALPFLKNGVATLIDKPIAGRLEDIDIIEQAADGTPFFGGSAVPFHPSFDSFPRGLPNQTIYCSGFDDPFYYGCHLVDTVRYIAGADWTHVRPADDPGQSVDVVFSNDAFATIRFDGPNEDSKFAFLGISDETRATVVDSDREERQAMYEGYLDRYEDVIEGDTSHNERVFDAARLLVAVHTALAQHRYVNPGSQKLKNTHIQGAPFVESYDPYY